MLYKLDYDPSIINTDISSNLVINSDEFTRITSSLSANGIAVIKNFLDDYTINSLKLDAETALNPNLDLSNIAKINICRSLSNSTIECHQPFLLSEAAVKIVTDNNLISLIEEYLEDKCIIHHSLFQKSIPLKSPAVDWHVDTGSNKILNGNVRLPDRRIRMIVYLSDVENGGLSYCLNSREATELFLSLPLDSKFPLEQIPKESDRFVNIKGKAGTVILFDAHGLHRPEPPHDTRIVLNTWFARSDFSGKTAPNLVNLNYLAGDRLEKVKIFFSTSKVENTIYIAKGRNLAMVLINKFLHSFTK